MICSKWNSNEKILGIFVDVLGIDIVDNKKIIEKDYSRFKYGKDISIEKYREIEKIIIKKISEKLKIDYIDLYHFFNVLSKIKLNNATLNASQTQLNFILLFDVVIPFLIAKLDSNKLEIIKEYIQEDIPFKKFLEKYPELKNKLKNNKNYDTVYKDLRNWQNGQNISKNSKQEILKIIDNIDNKEEFEIVVIIQNGLNSLKKYFIKNLGEKLGNKVVKTIISHIKILIECDFAMKNEKNLYQSILKKLKLKDNWMLKEYFYRYVERTDYIFPDISYLIHNENKIYQDINKLYEYSKVLILNEKQFFNLIDELTLINYVKANIELPYKVLENRIDDLRKKSLKKFSFNNDYIITKQMYDLLFNENLNSIPEFYERLEDINNPYACYLYGRYFLKKNDLKEALKYYTKALNGINCIGLPIKNIIEQGLMISAKLTPKKKTLNFNNNKSDFVKFYFEGYKIGILDYDDKNKNSILNDYKMKFERYFGNIKTLDINGINNYAVHNEDLEKIKPDFNNPNKKIKVPHKNFRIPQLLHFAGEGIFEDVKKLVENGADVNFAEETSNYTALIASLENPFNNERRKIAFYLIDKMELETIEKKLIKKKETALSYAINFGEVEIVENLLNKGVDISWNVRVGEGEATYLNLALTIITLIQAKPEEILTMSALNIENLEKIKNLLNLFPKQELNSIIELAIGKFYHKDLKRAKKIFDLIFDKTDLETKEKHKKDKNFMEQLKKYYPEKYEEIKL